MIIETFVCGPLETNTYLVVDQKNSIAAVIDPAHGSTKLLIEYINRHQLKIQAIYLTHSHFDHIADVAKLKECTDVPVGVHRMDAKNLEEPGSDGLPDPFGIKGVKPDFELVGGKTYSVGDFDFVVIETPGHTPGGVSFFFSKEKVLFSGDTLFRQSYGNLSFPGCDAKAMEQSLHLLAKLPEETKVYPGHGETTMIGKEGWIKKIKLEATS